MSKPVSETITIELLPETTSTSTESVTKVEKDVVAAVPVQIVENSIEENTDSTEKGSNTPKDDYAYYDDDQYDYYSMNNIKEKSDPYAHPEDISTNILTGIIGAADCLVSIVSSVYSVYCSWITWLLDMLIRSDTMKPK